MSLQLLKQNKCFGGWVKQFKHFSKSTNTDMTFSVFLPKESEEKPLPALYYLSGLTCTHENMMTKAGVQRVAAEHGIVVVAPDTSPRGTDIEGEHASYDFGSGAGFYVNATTPLFKKNYNMYDYVTAELPSLIAENFSVTDKKSVFGHSMGGHGALITALKNPGMFASCSAFSPICNPMNCPWGEKAFRGYLGEDRTLWAGYDATELAKSYTGPKLDILCDQGSEDDFLKQEQLLPEALVAGASGNDNVSLRMRMQDGYDHSYYFIASFIQDHVEFHAKHLK